MRHILRVTAAIALTFMLTTPVWAENEAPADTTKPAPPTPAETTLTEVGQMAPDFTVATLDGANFKLSAHRGSVVLINWFATWCPPCKEEMPHLQKEVWEKFGAEGLVMISVAREEKADVVAPFVKQRELTWTFGLDPERTAYAQYAEAYIPRNTLVGPDGKIIFQSEGFVAEDFAAMIAKIAEALGDAPDGQKVREQTEYGSLPTSVHGSYDEAGVSHEGDHRRSAELAEQVLQATKDR